MTTDDDRLAGLRDRLQTLLGPKGCVTDAADMAPHLTDWRDLFHGKALAVLKPASAAEVAEAVALCSAAGIAIVPQGGNTGLVGGATPDESGRAVVLSTERLNRVREIDPDNFTMTVEAGVVLQTLRDAAAEADRLFPLSFGAEGSCRIGGVLSTNAGGHGVLHYGMARDLVLGLEVVLPDGRIWDGLTGLRKDNTGYDLKQLFLGAEGTLGIITAAVLKLFPPLRRTETAILAVADPAAALMLLGRARAGSGDAVTAFELISRQGVDFALAGGTGAVDPLEEPADWYVLLELGSPAGEDSLKDRLEAILETAFEEGLVTDGAIAASDSQAQDFWHLRGAVVEGQERAGRQIKHDVSVPCSGVPAFIEQAGTALREALPGLRINAFGHVGDGNIHYNLSAPEGADPDTLVTAEDRLSTIVYDIVAGLGGSISAEHGIGQLKRAALAERKSPVALSLMRAIKDALDPQGLMNPGKVIPDDGRATG
ncbi:MAG: FAD-binding protein [Alphaproteobacteria bacterium]|jgi:FAD/FMN-containing dehydrogenase|nr:FAD-binding protein [Alphaproteobacteria bacterium]